MRALYCLLLICSLLPLSGCAELNISNPFETKSSDGSEVYFDQFPDVPIPRDMSVDAKRSLISVAQEQDSHSADKFINEYRAMMKQHVTYKTGIRDMVRLLRDGHYIGLLMDQDPGYTGIMVKFFGLDTLTANGPAKMSGIANYPIVPIFIREDRPYHHVVEVQPPLRPYTADHKLSKEEKERIMYETTQELNDRLEAHIRQYPEDWFWLHNRWKWTKRYKEKQAEVN